ncbi:hypothetical protein IVB14_24330 [Bradyrhizobium sp. 180]|uniref:hypothetical protein n=1 Tax=Bradyrhizobium sp. 180 TaxID=2782650 RepID=UPI001FF97B49|nr:hypothetical protein [Bradyrhizobium sp. 180]MCK1493465.1 hypothetical protein [Bradyrhizobium sp. 180]
MSTNKSQDAGPQEKRPQRKRTREHRERRDAAFTQKSRGRPKGTGLAFFDDPDRFAIAMIYCGDCFLGLPRYSAAYLTLALMSSKRSIAAGSIGAALRLSGGPSHSTLKGAAFRLIAKCDRSNSATEAEWIVSSAALLGTLVKLHMSDAPDPTRLRMVFDGLASRGWGPTLLSVAEKLRSVATSNLPPIDEAVSSRVRAWLPNLCSKPKS